MVVTGGNPVAYAHHPMHTQVGTQQPYRSTVVVLRFCAGECALWVDEDKTIIHAHTRSLLLTLGVLS